MEEIWKKITDFDNYSISNFGNVKNNNIKIILKLRIIGDYYRVGLCKKKTLGEVLMI